MSYIGPAFAPVPVESYDLLGTSLAIIAGIPSQERATRALADYPVVEFGSPVIWPQQPATAIYHNRAMWPFVSAYALRAARKTADAARIEHEIRSLMRGAATAGSNMENFELTTQAVHVDDGALSGPVVNSPRQLWSVAGYLDMVVRGVFGMEDNGGVAPLLPLPIAKELFGDRREITLSMPGRTIVLRRPKQWVGPLLGAAGVQAKGDTMIVSLGGGNAPATTLKTIGAAFAPPQPASPQWTQGKFDWTTTLPDGVRLYVDGKLRVGEDAPRDVALPASTFAQCITATAVQGGIESLPSPTVCIGESQTLGGVFPRNWSPSRTGRYRAQFRYRNANGPVNTGITAAVKTLVVTCGGERQAGTIVMPHREGEGDSTAFTFTAQRDTPCTFTLEDATNMSDLAHFAHYTGGKGGASGPLNAADVGVLTLMPAR
jgi:hypothetical protein